MAAYTLIGSEVVIWRPQRGVWANRSFPYRVIRGRVAAERPEGGRLLVEFETRMGARRVERCALETIQSVGGHRTPWAKVVG